MNVKRDANKRERQLADRLNMDKTLNSGAVFNDGDMCDENFMIDDKCTHKGQYILKRKDLEKLWRQAFEKYPSKIPVMTIDINGLECVVLTMDDFLEYKEFINEKTKDITQD